MNKKGKSCGRFFWSQTSLPKTQTTAWQLYQFQLESIESLLLQANRIISDFLLAGYAVNTGLVSLHPRVLGPWEGNEPFTEGKHKVKLDLGLDKSLREDLKKVGVVVIGEKDSGARITLSNLPSKGGLLLYTGNLIIK